MRKDPQAVSRDRFANNTNAKQQFKREISTIKKKFDKNKGLADPDNSIMKEKRKNYLLQQMVS
jgi:hypothetical protein